MTERENQLPPTILPDGQVFIADNKFVRNLADILVLSDEDSTASFDDLGETVFGSSFNTATHSVALNSLIDNLNKRLTDQKWQIANNGLARDEQKLWLAKVPEEVVEEQKALVVVDEAQKALEVLAGDFSQNFIQKLSAIDKANILEAMFRDPKRIKEEIDGVSKMVAEVRRGEYVAPQASQLLEGTDQSKVDLVKERLKGLMALSVIDPTNKTVRTKFGWGKELNEMILFAGGGETGREVVFDAIFNLNDVERALVLSQVSMSKRYEILMVGLDQINEREMASFINNAVYKFSKSGDVDELEEIITSISPRDNLDGFEAGRVIDALVQNHSGPDYIFRQLIIASKQGDFRQELMELFSCSAISAPLLPKIEDDDFDGDDIVRWNRRY